MDAAAARPHSVRSWNRILMVDGRNEWTLLKLKLVGNEWKRAKERENVRKKRATLDEKTTGRPSLHMPPK